MQWLYFAYLAAVKSQNGGAMSLGRTASFSISTLSATLKLAYAMSSRHRN
ncbi:pyruvate formate lyase family protein [Escherichia coli]